MQNIYIYIFCITRLFFSLFTFSSEATPSPQLVSLLFHSEKEEGKRGRGACKKKKERGKEEENGKVGVS